MSKVLLTAEAGNCHEGILDAALELVSKAKESGADLVKFQAGKAEGFARTSADIFRYRQYELGKDGYDRLIEEGKRVGIPVFFSVWSDDFWEYRNLEWFKIASRQCDKEYIAKYGTDKTFISVHHRMAESEIADLGIKKGYVMHCVSKYPADDPLLDRILRFQEIFKDRGIKVGYSDHTIGIEACISAYKLGADAIEKHFTLAHDFGPLRDHKLAATPDEFKEMVERIKG